MHVLTDRSFDAIVVGSGMSGGIVAKELCERGFRTLVLDRGRAFEHPSSYRTEHKRPWELPRRGRVPVAEQRDEQPIQSKVYLYDEATKHLFTNDRETPYVQEKPFDWIQANQVGGRSLMWARQTYRWSPMDFLANAADGHGVDWPIRYEDIAPWYDHVETFAGISGRPEGLPQLPDGKFLAPMDMNAVEKHAKKAIEAAFPGRTMTIGRCAVLSEAHNGRAACHYCGECERGCSTASYYSSVGVALPAATATGNMTLLSDRIVARVTHSGTRATSVETIHAVTGERESFSGRVIFMCASTLATTRILLHSTSTDYPNGLGNSSGVLGHYLSDHHMGVNASGYSDDFGDRYYQGRRPNGIYIPRFRNLGPSSHRDDYVRGFAYQGAAWRVGWMRGASEAGLGMDLKARLRDPGPWEMQLWGYGECLPRFQNHARLSETETDAWGLPLLVTSADWGDNEKAMRKDCVECAREMMEACGFRDITVSDDIDTNPPGLSIHEMGTARMGRDPYTSVLNAWNQMHDIPNVYVTDGSCMTSTAVQNPSITYMALSARAAGHAADAMRSGRF